MNDEDIESGIHTDYDEFDDPIDNIIEGIVGFFNQIEWSSCLSICREAIEDRVDAIEQRLDSIGTRIDRSLEEYRRTPADDLKDIANALVADTREDIPPIISNHILETVPVSFDSVTRATDIKVKLDKEQKIRQITVKYIGNNRYVTVPFENTRNPSYIQNVIDKWFVIEDNSIRAKSDLFFELEKYYKTNRKNNRTSSWFEKRTEWIKFSYNDNNMKPCGFKKFKEINHTDSEISEVSEEN
jgi:hypothetical protein